MDAWIKLFDFILFPCFFLSLHSTFNATTYITSRAVELQQTTLGTVKYFASHRREMTTQFNHALFSVTAATISQIKILGWSSQNSETARKIAHRGVKLGAGLAQNNASFTAPFKFHVHVSSDVGHNKSKCVKSKT